MFMLLRLLGWLVVILFLCLFGGLGVFLWCLLVCESLVVGWFGLVG